MFTQVLTVHENLNIVKKFVLPGHNQQSTDNIVTLKLNLQTKMARTKLTPSFRRRIVGKPEGDSKKSDKEIDNDEGDKSEDGDGDKNNKDEGTKNNNAKGFIFSDNKDNILQFKSTNDAGSNNAEIDDAESGNNEEEILEQDDVVEVLQPKELSFSFGTTLVFLCKGAVEVRKKMHKFIYI